MRIYRENLRSPISQMFYVLLNTLPQAFDRVYFPNDSELDNSRIKGISSYCFNPDFAAGFPDFSAAVLINGITYNVPIYSDLTNFVITVVDKKRSQVLSQYPLALLNNLTRLQNQNAYSPVKMDFSILTGESFITVINNAFFPPVPIAIPIEVFYEHDK